MLFVCVKSAIRKPLDVLAIAIVVALGNTGGAGGTSLPKISFSLSTASVTIVPVVKVEIAGVLSTKVPTVGVPRVITLPVTAAPNDWKDATPAPSVTNTEPATPST